MGRSKPRERSNSIPGKRQIVKSRLSRNYTGETDVNQEAKLPSNDNNGYGKSIVRRTWPCVRRIRRRFVFLSRTTRVEGAHPSTRFNGTDLDGSRTIWKTGPRTSNTVGTRARRSESNRNDRDRTVITAYLPPYNSSRYKRTFSVAFRYSIIGSFVFQSRQSKIISPPEKKTRGLGHIVEMCTFTGRYIYITILRD